MRHLSDSFTRSANGFEWGVPITKKITKTSKTHGSDHVSYNSDSLNLLTVIYNIRSGWVQNKKERKVG